MVGEYRSQKVLFPCIITDKSKIKWNTLSQIYNYWLAAFLNSL
jgi:hypothetical protein